MKKTIIPIVILYSFVSCVLDTMESMSIKNCTKDTVYGRIRSFPVL